MYSVLYCNLLLAALSSPFCSLKLVKVSEKYYNKVVKKRLTIKDQIFVKEFVDPVDPKHKGNATRAAVKAYGLKETSAGQVGFRKLKSVEIQNRIRQELARVGITSEFLDESLSEIINSGLKNKKYTKPAVALQAIIESNKLLDRYPAQKILNANLDLNRELESQPESELVNLMKSVQEQNKQLLERLERSDPV